MKLITKNIGNKIGQLMCPIPGNFAILKKNANARVVAPRGGGRVVTAGIDWWSFQFNIQDNEEIC